MSRVCVCVCVAARGRLPAWVKEHARQHKAATQERSWAWLGRWGCHCARVLLTRAAAVLVTIKLNTLARCILKPVINKCLKDTCTQQHMFSLWCSTMAAPHPQVSCRPPHCPCHPVPDGKWELSWSTSLWWKPPELQLQATGYRSRHEKFTADINKSAERNARHMIPAAPAPAASLVAAGRKAHSLGWCSKLFRLCRMEEKEVV